MDKVKLALAQLKKYHFWVLCIVIVLIGLLSWAWATEDLATQTDKRIKTLEGEFSGVQGVNSRPEHPNAGVIQAIHEAIDGGGNPQAGLKGNVHEAWKSLYKEQKDNNPLPTVLGDTFREHFEQLRDFDQQVSTEKLSADERDRRRNEILDNNDRDRYLNQIQEYFPKLFELIDVRRPKGTGGATSEVAHPPRHHFLHGGRPGSNPAAHNGGATTEIKGMTGVVEWDDANQHQIKEQFIWQHTPSVLEVRLSLENLWVYQALLRIIHDTNEKATYENAAIRKIFRWKSASKP